jgi:hypothetical protein
MRKPIGVEAIDVAADIDFRQVERVPAPVDLGWDHAFFHDQ